MTVQLNKASTFKTRQSKRKNSWRAWSKIIPLIAIILHRLWWQTKGYGTVFGMMGLVLISMVYLYLRSLSAKFFKSQVQEDLEKSV